MILSALGLILVLVSGGRLQLGPIDVSSRSLRNPIRGLIWSFALWYVLLDHSVQVVERLRRFALAVWRQATPLRRGLLVLLAAQACFLVVDVVHYPMWIWNRYSYDIYSRTNIVDSKLDGSQVEDVFYFAEKCSKQLPPDARILYHGRTEAMVFAYEVYPRRVFFVPEEFSELVRDWQKFEWWFPQSLKDPLESFWHASLSQPAIERDAFIRAHGLTHEVWYDRDQPLACRWRELR